MISLITKRAIILAVRDRWLEQYKGSRASDRIGLPQEPVGTIRKRLAALDLETCSEADVDAAIGTAGWAENKCDNCGANVEATVRIGDEPGYDARWQDVCQSCLREALKVSEQS